jgi:hypothetical protein
MCQWRMKPLIIINGLALFGQEKATSRDLTEIWCKFAPLHVPKQWRIYGFAQTQNTD